MNRRVVPMVIGSLLLALGCGGDDSTGPPTVVSIAVEGPPGGTASVGDSGPFMATASFSDGTTEDVTSSAVWTSSDLAVVTIFTTVDGQNVEGEAVGVGQSEICAAYQGVSGCVLVTVVP